jgi:hypothetical protein
MPKNNNNNRLPDPTFCSLVKEQTGARVSANGHVIFSNGERMSRKIIIYNGIFNSLREDIISFINQNLNLEAESKNIINQVAENFMEYDNSIFLKFLKDANTFIKEGQDNEFFERGYNYFKLKNEFYRKIFSSDEILKLLPNDLQDKIKNYKPRYIDKVDTLNFLHLYEKSENTILKYCSEALSKNELFQDLQKIEDFYCNVLDYAHVIVKLHSVFIVLYQKIYSKNDTYFPPIFKTKFKVEDIIEFDDLVTEKLDRYNLSKEEIIDALHETLLIFSKNYKDDLVLMKSEFKKFLSSHFMHYKLQLIENQDIPKKIKFLAYYFCNHQEDYTKYQNLILKELEENAKFLTSLFSLNRKAGIHSLNTNLLTQTSKKKVTNEEKNTTLDSQNTQQWLEDKIFKIPKTSEETVKKLTLKNILENAIKDAKDGFCQRRGKYKNLYYIDVPGISVLIDLGSSRIFILNTDKMGKSPREIFDNLCTLVANEIEISTIGEYGLKMNKDNPEKLKSKHYRVMFASPLDEIINGSTFKVFYSEKLETATEHHTNLNPYTKPDFKKEDLKKTLDKDVATNQGVKKDNSKADRSR